VSAEGSERRIDAAGAEASEARSDGKVVWVIGATDAIDAAGAEASEARSDGKVVWVIGATDAIDAAGAEASEARSDGKVVWAIGATCAEASLAEANGAHPSLVADAMDPSTDHKAS
jgi:hypothetical protein